MIISVISLICLFSGIASYLITLGLSFIGLSYLIIYFGVVSILFLFILMLIDIKIGWEKYNILLTPGCFSHLKCTLMAFEINYQVRSLSKQIHTYRCYTVCKDSRKNNLAHR